MLGLFLKPNAIEILADMELDERVRAHATEVIEKGYTVIRGAVPKQKCRETIQAFEQFEEKNREIFVRHKQENGRYPRIVNLHAAFPPLLDLFTENSVWLEVQDVLFGAPTALYTSLFYQVGSQQPLHRDTPVFATRPEYLYFGSTVYLERADDENGCLEVVEGGHLLPELDRVALAIGHYGSVEAVPSIDAVLWESYQTAVATQAKQRGLQVKRLYVEAGDSLIWHPQLPHGGSPIKNLHRTRYSLVMHNTPHGVPVYHQNVFFNPEKEFPQEAAWGYRAVNGRYVAELGGSVDFGHTQAYPSTSFQYS
jgi:phytanoyl-CoA hydroxylase